MFFVTREELIEAFNKCIRDKEEGLVVKKSNMKYKPNARVGSGCYKLKAEVEKHESTNAPSYIIVSSYFELLLDQYRKEHASKNL